MADVPLCGTATAIRRGPSSAKPFRRSINSGAATAEVGDHQRHVEGQALVGEIDHDVLDRLRNSSSNRSIRSRRNQPDEVAGSVEMMISSIGGPDGVHGRVERVGVPDSAGDRAEIADLDREVHRRT